MGDENPIRTLEDYSKPSHEGYRNTIELPVGNNVVPLQSSTIRGPHDTRYCMEDPEQAFVEYTSSHTDEAGDARLSKFQADFKQKQSKMTNKIDTVLKAVTHRIARALPSDTVKNLKLNASPVLESLELGKNGSTFVQGEVPAKMKDPRLFTLPCRLWDSKPFDTLADLGSCVNIIPLCLFKKLNIGLLEETSHIFGLTDETKSYPIGIVKDIKVHIGKLKLLNDFFVVDLKKEPETPFVRNWS
nr:hypothetical protein [Tanacetum cinerariifolium]